MSDLVVQIQQQLSRSGGRMTAQRRLILEALEGLPGHPTAEEIYQHVVRRDPTLNLSTVYRTLRWLESIGVVAPRWFEDDRRQERFDRLNDSHYHFRCRVCDRITEFADPQVEDVVASFIRQYGGRVESAALVLYGLCASCQAAQKET